MKLQTMKKLTAAMAVIGVLSVTPSANAWWFRSSGGGSNDNTDCPPDEKPVSVPDAGSTMLLLGIGLTAAAAAKRKWGK